jgi:adhesin transport system membrane fusion protein
MGRNNSGQRRSSALMWGITLVLGGAVAWASLAEIDQVTRAEARVIASSRTQVIQSPDGGVIAELLVREGDLVKPGQVLARLDATKTQAAFQEFNAKSAALRAQVSRLRAEMFATEPKFDADLKSQFAGFVENQLALYRRRHAAVIEEVAGYEKGLALVKRELEMNEPLLRTGDVSLTEVLKLQRQVIELQGQITNRRNKYFQEAQADLSKAEEELAGINQQLAQRKDFLEHTELSALVHGVVKNVKITTLGGVVRAGDEVMQIVPIEDDLIVEAKVRPADIAFVKPGLTASVKIDAWDYTIYGTLQGTVSYLSADTLSEDLKPGEQPYYRVQVKTSGRLLPGAGSADTRRDHNIEILPGMTATVEIKTGRKTVLSYLLKPIFKTVGESLGER